MTPPECASCGRRTELHDQFGNYRCSTCRAELWPHVFGDERPWLVTNTSTAGGERAEP